MKIDAAPLFRQYSLPADPVSVFNSLYGQDKHAVLYESLEHYGERGRYSFIGARPFAVFRSKGRQLFTELDGKTKIQNGDPIAALRSIINNCKYPSPAMPFPGGAVGYITYDAVRLFEEIPDKNPAPNRDLDMPDMFFIFPSEIITFDHQEDKICIVTYRQDKNRLSQLSSALGSKQETFVLPATTDIAGNISFSSNFTETSFCESVKRAREYIYAGDIFQVVLSQRFTLPGALLAPCDIYHALRYTNPAPYMYFLRLDDLSILGSSPETLVKLSNGTVISKPIAGTRPRGAGNKEDTALEFELLHDEKELAEHAMLVDLARNDLGRVCHYGSVRLNEQFMVEKFSRVMHITSTVTGRLARDKDAFDVLAAAFPAGTVSGAPKVRAMEIIDELEPARRGIYAGAIGYFGFDGNMDFCIAIRTIVMKKDIVHFQGGAGIVSDSIPQREYTETLNKTSALKAAIEIAGQRT